MNITGKWSQLNFRVVRVFVIKEPHRDTTALLNRYPSYPRGDP
jgi:hypothetical protein